MSTTPPELDTGHLTTSASGPAVAQGRRFLLAAAILILLLGVSLLIGSNPISPARTWHGLLSGLGWGVHDAGAERIVWELRLPRTVLAAAVGAALGVAGAVMQSLTRNPLADPGILGVNAGASLAVVIGLSLGLAGGFGAMVWWSMLGAGIATVVVHLLANAGGAATPVRLALAGTAVSACLVGTTTALTVRQPEVFDTFRYWAVGSFEGRRFDVVLGVAPFLLLGVALSVAAAQALDAVALGEDNARALGVRLGLTRALAGAAVTLLCGAAVAAAGPIGFVGLAVPHMVRAITGPDARRMLPACALAGAALVVGADVIGRLVSRPGELEAGVVTALVGAPFFVALVRRRGAVAL